MLTPNLQQQKQVRSTTDLHSFSQQNLRDSGTNRSQEFSSVANSGREFSYQHQNKKQMSGDGIQIYVDDVDDKNLPLSRRASSHLQGTQGKVFHKPRMNKT